MITVDRKYLRKGLELALLAGGPKRTTVEVLGSLKAKANGALVLESTDLDLEAQVSLPYSGKEAEFLIPRPDRLLKSLALAGGDDVTMDSAGEGVLQVSAGPLKLGMSQPCAVDDHPGTMWVGDECFHATLGEDALRQIGRVMAAVSKEETRYYLNGVHVHKVGDWLYRFVATDGHRLMFVDVPLPDAVGELPESTILSHGLVKAVREAFGKCPEPLAWRIGYRSASNSFNPSALLAEPAGASMVQFTGALGDIGLTLGGKRIDGIYPDYSRVVPREWASVLEVKRADLVQALRAVWPMSSSKLRAVVLRPSSNCLAVDLHDSAFGSARQEIAAESSAPEGFEIGFNGQYLRDMLGALSGESVVFRLDGPSSPTVIVDPTDTAFTGVLMPMRV